MIEPQNVAHLFNILSLLHAAPQPRLTFQNTANPGITPARLPR